MRRSTLQELPFATAFLVATLLWWAALAVGSWPQAPSTQVGLYALLYASAAFLLMLSPQRRRYEVLACRLINHCSRRTER